jgi:hypothetical protein
MRYIEIHQAVETLLGFSICRSSVKQFLSAESRHRRPRFARVVHPWPLQGSDVMTLGQASGLTPVCTCRRSDVSTVAQARALRQPPTLPSRPDAGWMNHTTGWMNHPPTKRGVRTRRPSKKTA